MFFDEVPIDLAVQAARQKLETILAYLTARHKHPVRSQTPWTLYWELLTSSAMGEQPKHRRIQEADTSAKGACETSCNKTLRYLQEEETSVICSCS